MPIPRSWPSFSRTCGSEVYVNTLVAAALAIGCDTPQTLAPPTPADEPLTGTGDYEFDGYEPLSSRPVRVYYHVPEGVGPDAPVVLVLHGLNRNADDYRDTWIPYADTFGFVIAAPQFREVFYGGSRGYALGNVFVDGDDPSPETLRDPAEWTFRWLEPVFDDVVARTPTEVERFQAFGHSAGAQFLHRYVQFIPDGRYEYVIAANAGWYTMPDDTVRFPYGLMGSPIEGGDRSFFGRQLVIHSGELDDNPQSGGLRRTPQADVQGIHRFDRGAYFVEEGAQLATDAGEPFAWERVVVPGVGHSQSGMGPRAAQWLAEALGVVP